MSDLARDLGLSKKASDILASRLHEKNLLEKGTKVSFYRTREREMLKYFRSEKRFIYCHDIPELGIVTYTVTEIRLDEGKYF